MRVYETLTEARSEIQRDIYKSPSIQSSRVQAHETPDAWLREALGYAYTITRMPSDSGNIATLAQAWGITEDMDAYQHWLETELTARLSWRPGIITEHLNPALRYQVEGKEPSYSYSDRLAGMIDVITETLAAAPDTRRAYWPIFNHEDALRANRMTRVPCSLGYQFMIRPTMALGGPTSYYLHVVYLSRSCDFSRFWLSDIWFAHKLKEAIYDLLSPRLENLHLGFTSHLVISLHDFVSGEIY